MAQSIDTKIVELKFNNDNFKDKVDSTLTKLQELDKSIKTVGLKDTLSNLGKDVKKVDISGITKGVEEASKGFSKMEILGITALANISNSVVNLGKKIVSNLTRPLTQGIMQGGLSRARNIEQATFQFEGQNIGKSKGHESLSYYHEVMEAVLGTSYSYDVAAKAASQLAASNVGVEKTMKRLADGTKVESKVLNNDMTKALLGIAGVASMTGSDFDSIAQIFTRVAGQGKVMAMDLNSIAARGLNAAAVLANSMGKTEAEIRDMVSKGKVSFADFSKAMSDAFGAHAKDSTLMFQGALDDVNAALARIGADFYGPALTAGRDILNSVTPLVDAIHNKLNPALDKSNNIMAVGSKRLSQYLDMLSYMVEMYPKMDQSGMNDWINEHMNAWTNIADLYKRGDVMKAIEGLKEYTASIKGMGGKGVDGFKMLGDYFNVSSDKGILTKYLGADAAERVIEKAAISTEGLRTVINGMVKDGTIGFNDLTKAFHKYWSESNKAMSIVHEDGTTLVDDFNKYLQGVIAADAPTERFNSHLRTFAAIMNGTVSIFNSFKTMLGGVASIFLTIAQHLAPLGKLLVDVAADTAQFVVKLADSIATSKRFTSILDSIVSMLNKLAEVLHLNKIASTALTGITKAFDFLATAADRVGAGVTKIFQTVAKYFNMVIDKIYEVLHSADIMKEVMEDLGKAGFVVAIINLVGALSRPMELLHSMSKAIDNVGSSFTKIFNGIGEVFSSIAGMFGKIGKVIDELTNALKRMQELLVATAIFEIALAIGVLAASFYLLSKVKADRIEDLIPTLLSFGAVVGSLAGVAKALHKVKSVKKIWERSVNDLKNVGFAMLEMAAAVAIMAAAIYKLSDLEPKRMYKALGAIEILLVTLGIIAKLLSGTTTKDTGLKALFAGKQTTTSMTKGLLGLVAMAEAVNILAAALVKVASISDPTQLKNALLAIEAILVTLGIMVKIMSSDKTTKMAKGATTLLAMALAVRLLAKPITELAAIDSTAMGDAVSMIIILMGTLAGMLKLMSGAKGSLKNAVAIIIIAQALKTIEGVAVELASLNFEAMKHGIGGVIALLFGVTMMLNLLDSKGILGKTIGILLVAVALKQLQDVVMTFGSNIDTAVDGLLAVAVALTGLLFILYAYSAVPVGGILKLFATLALGAAITAAFGAAIGVFGVGMSIFSAGLASLAGALTQLNPVMGTFLGVVIGFGVAIAILATVGLPAVGVLLALAGAFLLMGAGMALMGTGMQKLATSVELLSELKGQLAGTAKSISDFVMDINKLKDEANSIGESFKSISTPLASIRKSAEELDQKFQNLLKTYSNLKTQTSDAIGTLATSLTTIAQLNQDSFGKATEAIKTFITEMKNIKSDAVEASKSASEISTGITEMKKSIDDVAASLDGLGSRQLVAFDSLGNSISKISEPLKTLNSIKGSISTLGDSIGSFVDNLANMGTRAGEMSKSATDIASSLKQVGDAAGSAADSFAKFNEGNGQALTLMGSGLESISKGIQSIGKTYTILPDAGSTIKAFYNKLASSADVANTVANSAKSVSNAVKKLGIAAKNSITRAATMPAGTTIVAGIVAGINKTSSQVPKIVGEIANKAANAGRSKRSTFYSVGSYLISGLVAGIRSQQGALESQVERLEAKAERALAAKAKIKSPSRVWMKLGSYMGEGLAIGIRNSSDQVSIAAEGLGAVSEDAVSAAISAISSAIESDWNTDPTIKPVVDLSDIRNNAGYINSVFGGGIFGVNGTGPRMASSIAGIQNGSKGSSIDRLAKKIDGMTESMNSRSLNNYITVDGASDPSAFADDLIRSFRLNARTV